MNTAERQFTRDRRRIGAERPPAAHLFTDHDVERGRQIICAVQAAHQRLGMLALEIAPAYWSDQRAIEALEPFAAALEEDLSCILACRRYAVTDNWRSVQEAGGTLCGE
ncbi:hypothetical protein [Actinacidiphila glaucinigra]|uniref:hypothetical protein n=1 Tax=Actinacidiphila glaucinigra TaxID=235986 RepID=UPI0037FA45BE